MRASLTFIAVALLTAACGKSAPPLLADGCYYVEGKPAFRIAGDEGRLLVPGQLRRFRVTDHGTAAAPRATFAPGFMLDHGNDGLASVAYPGDHTEQTYPMQAKAGVPAITIYVPAYGEMQAIRGRPC